MESRSLLVGMAVLTAGSVLAGLDNGLPDETHAWGMGDDRIPQPVKVNNDFGGVPTDALAFASADKIDVALAADCQLHFCCKAFGAFSYFGTRLAPEVAPGADGWIVVDAVLHAGGEGHAGYAMLFVNGLFAGEFTVTVDSGAKPLVISGTEVCRLWARPSPPPWAEKLCGAYADRALIAEKRREIAEHMIEVLGSMQERLPGNRWGEGKHGFARRRMEVVVTAYAYCREAKFEKLFRGECDAYVALAQGDAERKTYASANSLLTISRLLSPLLHDGAIDKDFKLWKMLEDMGVKPW